MLIKSPLLTWSRFIPESYYHADDKILKYFVIMQDKEELVSSSENLCPILLI